jgi:hypothetical protein
MFLEGEFWKASCNNAYSDAVPLFALSLEKMTGYIPYLIKNPELPLERQDIWGTLYEHVEEPPKRKIIPIVPVVEKVVLDGIEVYTKTQI